ncbi:ECF transporter S component [Pseudarthrobacter sp. PS3-L1]|uniref:ECF transporter S component n=1 Tax=Pseudarthrobacter sp. PS3-L1 TaxID=3046207 RepID=UPI0024BACFC9|nr:ECF transporter S component [Pseudarthrobacter sp. PS3-L1]MDJ0319033.1 ECF transporter S component [Pseudarthrobacter sp. PS3-L1]
MSTTTVKKTSSSWRVVDIVVAALIAVTGGIIFWVWSQMAGVISAPMNALYPPLTGLISGGWMIPAILGMLIIRKPGAAVFCETVAATGELMFGSQYGATVLFSGFLQGLGAELVFLLFVYGRPSVRGFLHQKYNLVAALLAGVGAGVFCGLNDSFLPWGWNIAYPAGDKLVYIIFCAISGAVIAGGLSWIATRGLAGTGVLSSFASRKAATEAMVR